MKKLFLAFAAVAVLFAACSKENPTNEKTSIAEESSDNSSTSDNPIAKVYSLSATWPATRATVNEESGVFTWQDTDEIAVWDNAQSKYQVFTATGSGTSVTFTYTATDGLNHDFTSSVAYYPASRLNNEHTDVNMPIALASAGDVPMTATNDAGSLAFNYQSAVVKLTVNNVPSFAESVEFVNDAKSYAAEISHSINENMTFYLAVAGSSNASSSIILYDTSGNEIINKSFALKGGAPVNGALIPLKTTVGFPILVKNDTEWGGLDIYCYSATDSWKNANWGESLATVKTVTINAQTYSYIISKNVTDSYSFVFRKPNNDYPRVEHKGVPVSGETKIVLNTTNGARVEGDTTPRLLVYNQNKMGPVYLHYWGAGITGTDWGSNDSGARQMVYLHDGHMEMSSLCTGLIYTGNAANTGNWYFYYDIDAIKNAATFNFRLHQGENMGSEFTNVAVAENMTYGWWNNNDGGSWGAGAWVM